MGIRQWGPVRLGRIFEADYSETPNWQSVAPGAPRRQSRRGSFVQPCRLSSPFSLFLSLSLSLSLYPFRLSFSRMPALSFFLLTCPPPLPVPAPCRVPFRRLYLSPNVSSSFCYNKRFFRLSLPLSVIVLTRLFEGFNNGIFVAPLPLFGPADE